MKFIYLWIVCVIANIVDPDEMLHYATFHLGFYCLQMYTFTGLQIRVRIGKLFFLFLNQNICCGCSKERSQCDGSFEHPNHMFKLMGKEIYAILGAQTILIWTYAFRRH